MIQLQIVSPPSIYWESFKLLAKDLESSFRYVAPSEKHYEVYSLRYYELLLRACTEFESLCKEKVIEYKLTTKKSDKLGIEDYFLLNKYFNNKPSQISVGFPTLEFPFLAPLSDWAATHSLPWYQDYNGVKHNRADMFHKANLRNVLQSIAALFIMIERCKLCPDGFIGFKGNTSEPVKLLTHPEWPVVIHKEY